MLTVEQSVINSLKQHEGKWVAPLAAINGVDQGIDYWIALDTLERLVKQRIVEKQYVTEQHLPLYRYQDRSLSNRLAIHEVLEN